MGGVLSWGPLGSRMRNWVGGQVARGPLVATMGAAVSLVTGLKFHLVIGFPHGYTHRPQGLDLSGCQVSATAEKSGQVI